VVERVVLVRHGRTAWSSAGRHTGRTDVPLDAEGEQQARRLGAALSGRTFALTLTSPLTRARDTARLAGLTGAETCAELVEWDYGDGEGRTTAEIAAAIPGWTVWSHPVAGGETLDDVARRADAVIARISAVDGDVALVAHGHLLRILAARWCELAPVEGRRLVLDTATISELGHEHGVRGILRWNQAV
jgi:probable phosphoglycerate mutase